MARKGVEAQTRKLFKVCAMRHIPIFTFINKMDREAKDPFDLLEELERELGIETYAMNWPIGSGKEFQGVYDRQGSQLLFFSSGAAGKNRAGKQEIDLYDPHVADPAGRRQAPASSWTRWSFWERAGTLTWRRSGPGPSAPCSLALPSPILAWSPSWRSF